MTIKEYLIDDALTGQTTITAVFPGDKPIIRTGSTWFYPQGGGQKADQGRIGPCLVLHVTHNGNEVDHYVDSVHALEVGQVYAFSIDGSRRELNRVYHTAGHLIANIIERHYPLKAIAGHQWPGEARVEFEGDVGKDPVLADALSELIAADLAAGLQVSMEGDPATDRLIRIGDYPAIPCGGTHVRNLSEIDQISINAVKLKGGRLRVSYEAVPKASAE